LYLWITQAVELVVSVKFFSFFNIVFIVNYKVFYRQINFFYRHLQLFYLQLSSRLFWLNPKAFTYCMGPSHFSHVNKEYILLNLRKGARFKSLIVTEFPKMTDGESRLVGDRGYFVSALSWRSQPSSEQEAMQPLRMMRG